MKTTRAFYALPFLLSLLFFAIPMNDNAQILKKLSKGLERVNKGLERVNRNLDELTNPNASRSEQPATPNNNAANASSTPSTPPDTRDWEKVEQTYLTPYITGNTKYFAG